MKHRSMSEIIALILEAASENRGENQTKLMYKAFLSYNQLREYLPLLLERDLLEYYKEEHLYRITEKGKHFLYFYGKIGEVIAILS